MSEFTHKVSEEVTGHDSPRQGEPGADSDRDAKGVADPGAAGPSDEPSHAPSDTPPNAPSDPDDDPAAQGEPLNPA